MTTIEKQIIYWQSTAESDFETAEILINNQKYVQGLFFCHLCIEKMLKAHVVKATGEIPPKSHDLPYLSKKSSLDLSEDNLNFLQILMVYQLEGRYPEYCPKSPSQEKIKEYLCKTKDLIVCLAKMLLA